jgi:small subunit ribosomal protein S4
MISKPKYKIARRLGPGVYDKTQTPKFAASKKGTGESKFGRSLTEFGTQHIEKQKVRYSYGITERQLSNYVKKVSRVKGMDMAHKLYESLESRLDNVIYRMGLAASRRGARQMVSHGHFTVNGSRVTVPSFELKAGDALKVREGSKGKKIFENLETRLKDYNTPDWVSFDVSKMEGKILGKPKNMDTFLDLNVVLEFYSR